MLSTILLCMLWLGDGQGGHINRIMVVGQRSPMVFRPGASLRPWGPSSRLSQLPPQRAPYLFYRPQRYSNVKFIPSKYGSHPWRSTGRLTPDAQHSSILNNGIHSLNGVNLNNGIANGGLHAVGGGMRSVNSGLHGVNGGLHGVNGGIHSLNGGIHSASGVIHNGNGGIHSTNSGIHSVNDAIQSLKRGTPLVQAVTPEYEFVKAASQQTAIRVDGPIHTIPAPNLSLSDKPIIVLDNTALPGTGTTQSAKAVYEVTTQEVPSTSQAAQQSVVALRSGQHQAHPLGFSKATSLTAAELLQLVQNPAAQYHFSDGFSLPLISQQPQLISQQPQMISQHPSLIAQHHLTSQHSPVLQQQTLVSQPQLLRSPGLSHHLQLQGFNTLPSQNIIYEHQLVPQQNFLFKPEHNYISKMQSQLYQRFPGVDFSPISAGSESQTQIFITQDEKKDHRNQVRNTQEGTVVTIVPQTVEINDTTTEATTHTSTQPLQVQEVIVATEPQPVTTIRVVTEASTEPVKEKVIYAQLGKNVDDVVTTALYTAINEIRAAEALAQISERKSDQEVTQTPQDNIAEASMTVIHQALPDETPQMASTLPEFVVPQIPQTTPTTTPAQSLQAEEIPKVNNNSTLAPDLTPYFAKKNELNQTDIVPLHGAPFTKAENANVAYTFVKPEGDNNVNKDGHILKGQIVQATITEDEEFNKERASLKRGAPLRLIMDGRKNTEKSKKVDISKVKLPARSKLAYDEKTGEPVIRIYASYGSDQNDQPTQRSREALIQKQTSRPFKASSKSTSTVADWKSASVKSLDKSSGSDLNKISGFGVKLQPRIDDYVPAFDEY